MKIKHYLIKKISFITFFVLASVAYAKSPRVSIITQFNADDKLENYLNEITTKAIFKDTELFLITINSTAEQKEVITRYQYFYHNIQSVIATNSSSISHIINQALAKASAPFITLMNIDDYRPNDLLEAQIKELENNKTIDVVYGDYHISYSKNTATQNADNWYFPNLPEYSSYLLYRDIPGHHTLWRKSLHEKCGYLNDSFHFHHFWEFWNRCGFQGIKFKKVHGNPGTYYFNYFDQKKILFGPLDFEKSYCEEHFIREIYGSMWGIKAYEEKSFVIITASYNNKDWYRWNLDSVLHQNYTNYRIIYIDDKSPDQTGKLVQEYVKALGKEDFIQITINTENVGALANLYQAIHSCKKNEIVVILDGDDALAHNDVLKYLNMIYQDPNVWLTYGQFQWFPSNIPGFASQIPSWVIEQNSIREYRWVTTHLRTFYAGLFQLIKKEDFFYENRFCPKACDLAIMYPMIEMAGWHTKFIDEILMKYNSANTINDNKVDLDLQGRVDTFIRGKQRYTPISSLT